MNLPQHIPARLHANAPVCRACSFAAGCLGKCPSDYKPIHLHADAGYCPLAKFTVNGEKPQGWDTIDDATPTPEAKAPDAAEWGPKLWREFHAAPWEAMLLGRELDWLKAFAERVPCGDCRTGFLDLLEKHPPDLSSREAYFAWTVSLHNAVNRKLHKPEMTVEDARRAQQLDAGQAG